ncbi:uncharacterized protein LOC120343417 [Styela clava]|uniref:uncharacterized protein LOC120343416 n=1 Tax=Styela clava TaxID=7725 RepID=UPI001939C28A|nr:uncharacterized protein LOC120343416 [Styela clava]
MKFKIPILVVMLAVAFVQEGSSYKITTARLLSQLRPFYNLGVRIRTESTKLQALYWKLWSEIKSNKVSVHAYGDEGKLLQRLLDDIMDLNNEIDMETKER